MSSHHTLKAAEKKPAAAQDGIPQGDTSLPIVMNNDSVIGLEIHEAGDQPSNTNQEQAPPSNKNTAVPDQSVSPSKEETVELNETAVESNDVNVADRSDSEAETVVLEGKQEISGEPTGKAIKNEDDSDIDGSQTSKINGFHRFSDSDQNSDHGSDRPSLKRKRAAQEPTVEEIAPSSNLSSTISSPAARPHSSQGSDSDSDHSRSTPPLDEGIQQKHAKSWKPKSTPSLDDLDRKKRGKSDPNSVTIHRKERRETRSATHHQIPRHRSDSPPSRRHRRAPSVQSVDLLDKNTRKKAPPPLLVERRRKISEDAHEDSDDSSSLHSHPHLRKVASVDHTAISPAKISMKKNRDRNGRTLLARACALDFNEAKKWLRERSQDIDVPDNAGNTPLQIASLEGLADVVQLLLDAGCDTNCKNIDMETPLIDAVENGHLDVVILLLNAGLDPRQSNAKGEEPLDLVNPDNDEYDEIRAALMAAKESNTVRRPSEDHSAQHRDNDMSSVGASAASPTDGPTGKSPPPFGLGARRRTARSQPTQDSLLWVNPTPAKLREACGRGDLSVVNYILGMRPDVGTDAVIAAARGGHDVVLEILFAIGQLEHDPDPVVSDDFQSGRNTPMLAAIGRGHIAVIKLLVSQRGFNPTRRIFRGLTYHELAKERQGSSWEEEYSILKEAYDDYKIHGGRRSTHNSPRKPRSKRPEADRSSISPTSSNKRQLSSSSIRTAPEPEIKREHSQKTLSNKRLRLPEDTKESAVVSDRESEAGRPEPKPKVARSVSDAGAILRKHSDSAKPKRKLLSRNDLESDHDSKRRTSLTIDPATREQIRRQSGDSDSFEQQKKKRKTIESSNSAPKKVRRESSKEVHSSRVEPGKKRPRLSASPQPHLPQGEKSTDTLKIKKKRRVDSEGNAVIRDPQRSDTFAKMGPAMVANMIASPEQVTSPSEPPSRAPVANMGVSSASPVTKSPTEPPPHSETHSPMSGIEQTLQPIMPPNPSESTDIDVRMPDPDTRELDASGLGSRQAAQGEEEHKKSIQRDEQARQEQQRQAEEAERQAQREREEEEARVAKKRREEELARRRAEQERLRHADQERRRAEHEERERLRRIRLQEEEQQALRDALPNSLRRAAELSPEKARQPQEVRRWLPLYTVTTREIDPGCDEHMAEERWIANVQVAPVLAIKDLDLSQCKFPVMLPVHGHPPTSRYHGSDTLRRHSLDPPPSLPFPATVPLAPAAEYDGSGRHQPSYFYLAAGP